MAINDIQARLDKKVEEQANRDFKKAIQQAEQILTPFFKPVETSAFCGKNELAELQEAFKKCASIGRYGSVYLCREMTVPMCYIHMKKAEASKEFIEKVNNLQDQINELYDTKADR